MTLIRLVADDLTGALDSSAQFAGLAPIEVSLRRGPPYPHGSFGLNLSCRDGAEDEAISATLATADCFERADVAFKKIDSLLRGHWAGELAAIASKRLFRRIILAPAFPAHGRLTRGGRQLVISDTSVAALLDVEPDVVLSAYGASVSLGLDASTAISQKTPIFLCDASTESDLADIVRRGRSLPGPTLWCGSAGLARALSGFPPSTAAPHKPHLVIVGSNHPATRAQVAMIAQTTPEWLQVFNSDGASSAARIAATLRQHGRCVALAELRADVAAAEAARAISDFLRTLVQYIDPPQTITVVGGETFGALCEAVGAQELAVLGETSPGIPASTMTSGLWAGLQCFSKSGAFGDQEWLLRHLAL